MIPQPTKPANLAITKQLAATTLPNIPNQPLHPTGDLYITVHETANEAASASAKMHADYVCQGGGPGLVSFHFTVDRLGAYQMIPLDKNAWHAADGCDNYEGDLGCFASIAIETCVNDPVGSPGWLQTVANLQGLILAILGGDSRLAWGTTKATRFHPDRIRPHHRWSLEGKWCPTRILNAKWMDPWTGAGPLVESIKQGMGTTPAPVEPSYSLPVPTPDWSGEDVRIGSNTWRAIKRKVTVIENVRPLAYFDPAAPAAGPVQPAGTKLNVEWHVTTGTGNECWVTKVGWRIDATKIREKVKFT